MPIPSAPKPQQPPQQQPQFTPSHQQQLPPPPPVINISQPSTAPGTPNNMDQSSLLPPAANKSQNNNGDHKAPSMLLFDANPNNSNDNNTSRILPNNEAMPEVVEERKPLLEYTDTPLSCFGWSIVLSMPTIVLLILILVYGGKHRIPNGTCDRLSRIGNSEAMCASIFVPGFTLSYIGGDNSDNGSGCGDMSQACGTSLSAADLYSDENYNRCWHNMERSVPVNERIWIMPAQTIVGETFNLTRAVACCRTLPGGAQGPSMGQIVVKGLVGVTLDTFLNLLMKIKWVAKFVDLVMLIPVMLTQKLENWGGKSRKEISDEKRKELIEQARERRLTRRKQQEEQELYLLGAISGVGGGAGSGGGVGGGAAASMSLNSGSINFDASLNIGEEDEDDNNAVDAYFRDAEKDREAAAKNLGAASWVDEAFLPSSLLIIKASLFAYYGVYLAIRSAVSDEFAGASTWTRYNAFAAQIVNGQVFGAWLDMGALFAVFYALKTDIFRQRIYMSCWYILKAMTDFVILMFSTKESTRDPVGAVALSPKCKTTTFFTDCLPVRIGLRLYWVCYLAPYVTHICGASFYYMGHLVAFFFTITPTTGLLCCAAAYMFDSYGDNWRSRLAAGEKAENLKLPMIRTFVAHWCLAVLYTITATLLYTQLCNYFVLMTSEPEKYGGANYNRVMYDDWSIRNSVCANIQVQYAFATASTPDIIASVMDYF